MCFYLFYMELINNVVIILIEYELMSYRIFMFKFFLKLNLSNELVWKNVS